MQAALGAYLRRMDAGSSHQEAVIAAARAVRRNPWNVVHYAGLLARCRAVIAAKPLGLSASLRTVPMESPLAVAKVAAGARYPKFSASRRFQAGAHDAPVDMARKLVDQALLAADGPTSLGLDTACGPGAFLVAMAEAGLTEIYGVDQDPLLLEVAAVACPRARLLQEAPFLHGPPVDIVVGAPPFIPHHGTTEPMRFDLRHRFPWLGMQVDLVGPFAASASNRVRPGGGIGLVLPTEALVRDHGENWRRRFLGRHRIVELVGPVPFPGSRIQVTLLVAQAGSGPATVASLGIDATEVLSIPNAPMDPALRPGDAALLAKIAAASVPLSEVAEIDSGLTVYPPDRGSAPERVFAEPGDGRVPYAQASDFFLEQHRWLQYRQGSLHRGQRPGLFEGPKVVVQRMRGRSAIHAGVDRQGIYVGHTCSVVRPTGLTPEAVAALLSSPLIDGWLRLRNGRVTDLTPRVLSEVPCPKSWLEAQPPALAEAWGLDELAVESLTSRAVR